MPERPLLLFPTPELADRTTRPPMFPGAMHRPSVTRQGERLSPIFRQLQMAFNAVQVDVQANPAGIDPEQVLVIETVGSVEKFANAVKRIEGLEWMGEIETDDLDPDTDFYLEDDPNKELTGRLYLVMTNQQALNEMLSLWRRYEADPNMTFAHGLAKFRDVFLCLKNIRRWGTQDRLEETGTLQAWREDLQHMPGLRVRFETELWFRGSEQKRSESAAQVAELIRDSGGEVLGQCTIDAIAYHSLLAEIPAESAERIIEHPEVALTQCDSIMFFRPVGQTVTEPGIVEREVSEYPSPDQPAPQGEPIVALLDGMPLENHQLLTGRIQVDDPDDWATEYPAVDRQHGTAMASLIVHGDLNSGTASLARPIYVRPVMKPMTWLHSPRPEHIPADVLLVDHIHRAVKRLFEGGGGEPAAAPTVRIVNFSIGDRARQFTQLMSPLARLLDWLSFKYQVLFVISAGNQNMRAIDTGLSRETFGSLAVHELERLVVSKLYDDARHRRLLSPGESVNGITVGAAHYDAAVPVAHDRSIDVFTGVLPSPISPFGTGYRRAVKPDLIVSAGRVHFNEPLAAQGTIKLDVRTQKVAPGNRVAAPGNNPGDLAKTTFTCGTSNAAALMSRSASLCHDALVDILQGQAPGTDLASCIVPLIKAMLIHGCSWNEVGPRLDAILRTLGNGTQVRNWISRWLGYGMPDIAKALECSGQRASVIGFGRLDEGQAHVFSLPLPPSLGARREWRKLTVTLAWLSPVASTTQRYRVAQLWFEFEDGKKSREKLKQKLNVTGTDVDGDATRRGTVQHEVFEGDRAVAITDGDTLRIKVNCRKDAGKLNGRVCYGLLVSMEVAEGVDLPIYDEIRTRIAPAIEIRPQDAR